jgi:CRISPR/Cas system-associated exonuclease Cas4 (RecB family)
VKGLLHAQQAVAKRRIGGAYALGPLRGYDVDAIRPPWVIAAPVSTYVTFLRCPRCAYLSLVSGMRFSQTKHSVRGMLHHRAFEYLMAGEFRLATKFRLSASGPDMMREFQHLLRAIKESLARRFLNELQSVGADFETEWRILERHLREAYQAWLNRLRNFALTSNLEGVELAKAFVPMRKFEVSLSAPVLGFSAGRIDVIEDGLPVEIKSGVPPKDSLPPAHVLQMTYYALLLEYCTGRDVNFGEIYYTSINQRRRLAIDREKRLLALWVRDEAMEAFRRREPPDTFCRWCSPLSEGEPHA